MSVVLLVVIVLAVVGPALMLALVSRAEDALDRMTAATAGRPPEAARVPAQAPPVDRPYEGSVGGALEGHAH
jgi:hypothetical protein